MKTSTALLISTGLVAIAGGAYYFLVVKKNNKEQPVSGTDTKSLGKNSKVIAKANALKSSGTIVPLASKNMSLNVSSNQIMKL